MKLKTPPSVDALLADFDSSNAPLDLLKVAGRLSQERQAIKERNAPAEEDHALWCELVVFYLRPSFEGGDDPWESFFRPMSSMTSVDGTTTFTPDINDANSDAVAHWSQRAREAKHPILRARYADIVWEFGRLLTKSPKRDVEMARLAVDAYVEAVTQRLTHNLHDAFTNAKRAVDLASQIGDKPRIETARAALLALHADVMKEAKAHLWARAFDHLIDHRKAGTTPAELATLAVDLEAVLVRVSDSSNPSTFDPHAARDAATRLTRYYTREGRPDEAKRLLGVVGRSFEFTAGQGNAMQAASFLQDSLEAYKQAGMSTDADRTRLALQRAVRASQAEMATHSMEIRIPKENMDKVVETLVVDDVGQTLANIAMAFVPKISALEAQVAQLAKDAPLFAMVTQQIFAGDHVAAKVGSVEDDGSGRLLRQAQQSLQFHIPYLHASILAAIEKHKLTPELFVHWANRHGHFDDGKLGLLQEGVTAWFDKDHVKALHVIIPQIEGALRQMVHTLGKPTTKPAGTVPGVSVAINMGDILFNPDTVAALGPRGPDFALYMKAVYADPRGWNLRNEFAHGLLDTNDIHGGVVLWLIHTLLVIGAWNKLDRIAPSGPGS